MPPLVDPRDCRTDQVGSGRRFATTGSRPHVRRPLLPTQPPPAQPLRCPAWHAKSQSVRRVSAAALYVRQSLPPLAMLMIPRTRNQGAAAPWIVLWQSAISLPKERVRVILHSQTISARPSWRPARSSIADQIEWDATSTRCGDRLPASDEPRLEVGGRPSVRAHPEAMTRNLRALRRPRMWLAATPR